MTDTYNQFSLLANIPYNIVAYLLNNNDEMWKLLKYNDPNAWKNDADHPNRLFLRK